MRVLPLINWTPPIFWNATPAEFFPALDAITPSDDPAPARGAGRTPAQKGVTYMQGPEALAHMKRMIALNKSKEEPAAEQV